VSATGRTTRRALLLLGALLTIALTTTGTAQAAFTKTLTVPPATISTATVQPVSALSTLGSTCSNGTLNLHLSWTKSTTARVSSYRIRMYTNVGINWALGTVSAGATSYDANVSVHVNNAPTMYQFTVTTLTDYGWTTESARTGALSC
jgi:hypothetical protein